ncbi:MULTISPECIES: TIGR02302 family protein [Alphaproteobacteria]|uniref:Membrane protein n=2 Tax=Alphaproteobacteria TaxID=28211 RepID=A0A512HLK5_9HYPH|nr:MULTISPECIES: TIGR02302 family protein [Alphaproteobacteria]GEO86321.1 membrane protein [Ciceribacter naphthalenivorans]GLR21803.1 membrane protein [Ciceribacter naphthalenivorans]GLT04659.1 membrane protein [Sphingomonas psychrolutea]
MPLQPGGKRTGAFGTDPALARRVAVKRFLARLVLFAERLLPLFLPLAGIAAIFVSLAWLGVYRQLPDLIRLGLVFVLTFGVVASLLPFARLRWPAGEEADRLLEERNHLAHQPVAVQDDEPAFDTPFARALWVEHQRRMAETIAALDAGLPRPDIARFDRHALRAVPALLFVTALAYSGSNGAGVISDAFRQQPTTSETPGLRIDAWITPPAYTGQAPVFLSGRDGQPDGNATATSPGNARVPQNALATVRISGGTADEKVLFRRADDGTVIDIARNAAATAQGGLPPDGKTKPATSAAGVHEWQLETSGTLLVGGRQWAIDVVPDKAPEITFDGLPRRSANGALEIGFKAKDDYGLAKAYAEIEPLAEKADAIPLYALPEYKLDLPRHNARDAKGLSSRNITEHPLSGRKVRITLVATDGAGQTGRSQPYDMVLPARAFIEPLAAAVAEERQVFALDIRELRQAIALNEALSLRADETIPNMTHYLLIQSAQARMKLARSTEQLKDTADYLWEIALGIDGGDISLAERKLRDAQQALADALERNAPDEEIKKLMDELRAAMQGFIDAMAERQPNAEGQQPSAQNMLRQRDLENMMNQIENLARSGNRDAARQMLSELQRMMNNLQAGRPQRGGQQQENSQARQQIDKLGEVMQDQQKLMDETFRLDQALKDRMQRGDPGYGEDGEFLDRPPQGQNGDQDQRGQQGSPTDRMTADELREALKNLRAQQDALGKKLGELEKGLSDLGVKPGESFGQAKREMRGAGEALGQSQGDRAVEGQGKALEALRQGARDMMNQMTQAMRGQQGQQQSGQNGRDPLGRPRATSGPDFGERVNVPDEIDVQRAREILEAIRKKLGDNGGPELERRYLERLLDIQ